MKKQNKYVATLITAMSLATVLPQSLAFAGEHIHTPMEYSTADIQQEPRFEYLARVSVSLSVKDSGASYSLNVTGISDVEEISGWATLYKKSGSGSYYEVSSESFSKATNNLSWHSVLPTDGSGTYRLEIDGTAYTSNGSEDFFKTISRSY